MKWNILLVVVLTSLGIVESCNSGGSDSNNCGGILLYDFLDCRKINLELKVEENGRRNVYIVFNGIMETNNIVINGKNVSCQWNIYSDSHPPQSYGYTENSDTLGCSFGDKVSYSIDINGNIHAGTIKLPDSVCVIWTPASCCVLSWTSLTQPDNYYMIYSYYEDYYSDNELSGSRTMDGSDSTVSIPLFTTRVDFEALNYEVSTDAVIVASITYEHSF